MRKRLIILATAAAMLLVAAIAYATPTNAVSSKASKDKSGSKAKPAQFNATYAYNAGDTTGGRAPTPISWTYSWNGVAISGKGFPTCTKQQIDAAQSDSVCPKGSLVGTAQFTAKLGPSSDPNQNVGCTGKTVRGYNGGNALVWFIVGPGTNCAGIGYLPPFNVTYKTSHGTTRATLLFPLNITHPLPGIEGGLNFISWKFSALKRGHGKKTAYYMTSTGCKGHRTFTFVIKDAVGTHTVTANAGKCTK